MKKAILVGALAWAMAVPPPLHGAEAASERSAIPEDLADAWDRLQRALQDWGSQLRERFGSSDSRDDRPVISEILNAKEYLGLSPEQVRKLEQLRDDFQRQSIRKEADRRILELDIAALLDQQPVDVSKVEAKIREVEKLRADLRVARVHAIEQAKGVLTAEQRKKFYSSHGRTARPSRAGENPSASEPERSSR